ncbi:MAG: amidohydrolase family protein [Polyangiales bacterium]
MIKPARIDVDGARITRVEVLPSNDVGASPDVAAPGEKPSASQRDEHDLGERLITPAFVNAHTHLALAFLRGVETTRVRRNLVEDLYFAYESRLSADDIRAFARMGAYESLLSGVGLVWDHYYGGSAVADALRDTGLAGVVAPTLQDLAGPDRDGAEAALDATLRIADDARYRAASVFAALGPHATDTVSPGLFRRIAELSEQRGLPVHLHVAQSYDELARVEAREGRSPLALLAREGILSRAPRVVMAHGLFASIPDLRALDPSRHTLVYCPSSQLQFGFPAPVSRWSELGVSWVVATDCASSNDSMNVQKELRFCAGAASAEITGSLEYESFLSSGEVGHARDTWHERTERAKAFGRHVNSEQLLARVWSEAGALHPEVETGVIARGALANLAVWNTDHPAFWPGQDLLRALAMSDISQALHGMYVAGRAVGEPGHLVESVVGSDAYREARREADGRLAALMR